MRPKLTVLSDELVEQIIQEGMRLLLDPGVRVHNHEALTLLAEAGAEVDFEQQIAKIPEAMVLNALHSAPGEFFLYNLDGQPVVHYGGDDIHFDPGSSGVAILASLDGAQRSPTTADFVKFIKLVEMLPQYEAQSTAFVCRDVPEGMGDLYRLYLALNFMRKPIITGAFGKETFWVMVELLSLVAGGAAALAEKPTAVFDVCPSPPLLWSDLTCQNLIDCARRHLPAELISMPLAGATSPVTLAAAAVQHTAESFSGLVIHQLAQPGAPIVWGGAPAAFDMREGTTPMGDVNTWLIDCAYIQIGKRLNLPTHTYMGSSDAKVIDAQAGFESMGGALLAALTGANMISGGGMLDFLRCQSLEKLVIDAEMIGMAKRLVAGIEPRDQPIALTLMRQAGHKANFLSQPHTQRMFRKELYIPSPVVDRGSWDAWQKKGSQTCEQRASERVEALLRNYQPNGLSAEARDELRQIVQKVARQHGMAQLPPLEM